MSAQTVVDKDPVINTVGNKSNKNNNPSRPIKCYCNDDLQCPRDSSEKQSKRRTTAVLSAETTTTTAPNPLLSDMLMKKKIMDAAPRYCQTNTMCMTKRLKKKSGETWLKYTCDQSPPNSIKGSVIEYRDCRVNTASQEDQDFVYANSAEFCCNNSDFCNVDLEPRRAVIDLVDFTNGAGTIEFEHKSGNVHPHHSQYSSFFAQPANIMISCLAVGGFIVFIIFFAFHLYKKAKRRKDSVVDGDLQKPKLPLHHHGYMKKPIYQEQVMAASLQSNATKSTAVSTSSSCSPYSTSNSSSASSTTNTSLVPSSLSKENSTTIGSGLGLMLPKNNSYKMIYEEAVIRGDEAFEPLLKLTQSNPNTNPIGIADRIEDNTVIKLNSPLSSTQSSVGGRNASVTTATTSTGSGTNTTTTMNTTTTQTTSSASANHSSFEWSGSGSGAGVPECVARTIARQIKLIYPCIGKGRFGEVYKGEWREQLVAVKTFNSADERSWENECEIYQTPGFRHENILGFIAADNIDRGLYTELWIITEFHPRGSLYDYLSANKVEPDLMLKMALSIVNGLDHMHTPIESCKGKPALAHCDLKSKNVLVKADLTCCIGDLGLALAGDTNGYLVLPPSVQIRTGTKRYMAPEILSKSMDMTRLGPFQKAEIYSLSLIFWELLRACRFEQADGTVYSLEYKLPYYEYLGDMDPDETVMRQIVCEQRLRPGVSPLWKQPSTPGAVSEFAKLAESLWCENPEQRLSALRIKKCIMKIKNDFNRTSSSSGVDGGGDK